MLAKIIIDPIGDIRYFNEKDDYHRVGGPAVEYADGFKAWYINGKLHRLDGPAFEYANGIKIWFIRGIQYSEEEFNKIVGGLC